MYKECLIIVDVQKGFINEFTKEIPKKVEKLQYEYKYVIITQFINKKNSPFHLILKWFRFAPTSKDIELAFIPRKNNVLLLRKYKYSCVSNKLVKFLKEKKINEVHICGIDTDICVSKCAVDLFELNIKPVVLSNFCASHGGINYHNCGLSILRRYIGKDNIR